MEFGLIGEKLGHSFSKVIHDYFAPYSYEIKEIPKENFEWFIKNADFKGINITIPYKKEVMPYLDVIDDDAKRIGAVNTVIKKDGKLYGYNTDFSGLRRLILKNGFDLEKKKVLILGSGGTSDTAYAVCQSFKAEEIYKVSRNGEVNYENVKILHPDADFIINTTPCGMYPDNNTSALTLDGFSKLEGVIDVVYNPLETKLVMDAKKRGIKGCCGLYMLVSQAILAGEIFTDSKFSESVFNEAYRYVLSKKRNIVLTGMAGCGKSTVGRALSDMLSKDLVDTDELVIKNESMEIKDIFSDKGEAYFRDAETQAVKTASERNGVIIATGGGAVLRTENVDFLKSNGIIFFLDRPIEQIIPTDDRPLSSNRDDLTRRFNERYPVYIKTADAVIDASGSIEDTAEKILEYLNENISY